MKNLLFFLIALLNPFSVEVFSQPVNWSAIDVSNEPISPRGLFYSQNLDMTIYCRLFDAGPGHYYIGAYSGNSWEMLLDSMNGIIWCGADVSRVKMPNLESGIYLLEFSIETGERISKRLLVVD